MCRHDESIAMSHYLVSEDNAKFRSGTVRGLLMEMLIRSGFHDAAGILVLDDEGNLKSACLTKVGSSSILMPILQLTAPRSAPALR